MFLNESFYLRMGSTWLIDGIYIFLEYVSKVNRSITLRNKNKNYIFKIKFLQQTILKGKLVEFYKHYLAQSQ